MEDYGTTAKFTQFTTVLAVVQSALAVVVGEIGIEKTFDVVHNKLAGAETYEEAYADMVRLLRVTLLSLLSGQKLVFEPKRPEYCEILTTIDHLGLCKTDVLSNELSQLMRVNETAFDFLSTTGLKASQYRRTVDLVKVSAFQLGFTEDPTYDQICLRAMELGYGLCPSHPGVLIGLRKCYLPSQNRWIVATTPLSDSPGALGVFELSYQEGDYWLGVTSVYPGLRFPLSTELILEFP